MSNNNDVDEFSFFASIENNKNNISNFTLKETNKMPLELTRIDSDTKITADTTNKNIPKCQPDYPNLENFDDLAKKKIFKIKKVKKIFITIIIERGRPPKKKKIILRLDQGKNRDINAFPKIRNSVRNNIDNFIKRNFKELGDLDNPIIEGNGKICNNKSVYEMYCDFVPKKFKIDLKIEAKDEKERQKLKKKLRKEAYLKVSKNKRILDKFINPQIKSHDIIFNVLKFKDFLRPYLKNEKRIIKYDKKYGRIVINLNGFETYDEFFNWEYDKNQKETFKEHMLNKLDEE